MKLKLHCQLKHEWKFLNNIGPSKCCSDSFALNKRKFESYYCLFCNECTLKMQIRCSFSWDKEGCCVWKIFSLAYNANATGCFMSRYLKAYLYSRFEKTYLFLTLAALAALQTPRTRTGTAAAPQGTVLHFLGPAQQTWLSFTASVLGMVLFMLQEITEQLVLVFRGLTDILASDRILFWHKDSLVSRQCKY